jgi:hypothetical protein
MKTVLRKEIVKFSLAFFGGPNGRSDFRHDFSTENA